MAKGGNDGWIAAKPTKKGKIEEKVTSKAHGDQNILLKILNFC